MQTEVDVTGDREPIDRIADEFLARYRGGERPAISEYTAAHPELAAEIRELFPTLVVLEQLGPRPEEILEQSGGPIADAAAPQQLGDYRILREVGRGGMGVVYEAVQESLGRHVALKVLPSRALLDAVRLKRFQHEAQAAAKLHHTNIVPVFGVGTAEGVHFYAMQYIPGRGLNEVIDEVRRLKAAGASGLSPADREPLPGHDDTPPAANLSTISDTPRYYRSVARLGAQVADALAHAHRQGVLHRDIKPANLLLDAGGTVWVTDFGLAKAEGMEELTQPGDVIGTLRYTAPEQLRGDGDARSDIYSLGVTLYELLTLRPAFDAIDRITLLRQIAQEEPPRPRKLDRRIPRDLETIVLKAITKEPARRYATAGDLAEDLRRFLGDRPIEARRTPWWEHMGRWCRRNPAVAASSALGLAALLIGLGVALWQWDRAERNYKQAEASTAQADKDFRLSFQAIDGMLTRIGLEDMTIVAKPEQARRELLEDALRFYENLLLGNQHRPELRVEFAKAHWNLGQLNSWLGNLDEAETQFERGVSLFELLLQGEPDNIEYRRYVAESYVYRARIRLRKERFVEAETDFQRSLDGFDELLAKRPQRPQYLRARGIILHEMGQLKYASGRWTESEQRYGEALAILEPLHQAHPDLPGLCRALADTLNDLAVIQQSGRKAEAEQTFRRALEFRQRESPTAVKVDQQVLLAKAYAAVAGTMELSPTPNAEAEALFTSALEIGEGLVRSYPTIPDYQRQLALTSTDYGTWLNHYQRSQDAEQAHARAILLLEGLVERQPTDVELHHRLGGALHNSALVLRDRSDLTSASTRLEQAIEHQQLALRGNPHHRLAIEYLAKHYSIENELLRKIGSLAGIERKLRERSAFLDELVAKGSPSTSVRTAQIRAQERLAWHLAGSGDFAQGDAAYQRSLETARQAVADVPGNPYLESELGAALNNYAILLHRHRQYREMVPLLEEAIGHQEAALQAHPNHRPFLQYLYNHHSLFSEARLALGEHRLAAAEAALARDRFPDFFQDYLWAGRLARCLSLAEMDANLAPEERDRLMREYAERSLELLRAAKQKKSTELAGIATDSKFKPLHNRPDFQDLLLSVKQNAN